METEDPFSSFIIHPNAISVFEDENPNNHGSTQIENTPAINYSDASTRQKLKSRRREDDILGDTSNLCASRYKLIVKYGGYFKPINNETKKKYYASKQRTIYSDEVTYDVEELFEEVRKLYPEDDSCKLSLLFVDKRANSQSFVQIEDEISYKLMLSMYEEEKKVIIYVTEEKVTVLEDGTKFDGSIGLGRDFEGNENWLDDVMVENEVVKDYEDDSDYCCTEDSYSSLGSDTDCEIDIEYEGEFYSYDKDDPKMEVGAQYPHVVAFRRALCHFAIINDFEFNLDKSEPSRVTATCANRECKWRIHAATTEDGVTFIVRTLQAAHSCCGVNRCGNKHANKGWVADRIINDLKKEGDLSAKELKRRLDAKYGLSLSYNRVWKAKEQALEDIYGKWKDSLDQVGALREEILKRNPGSVVELKTEAESENGKEQHFQRFFVALGACTSGFLTGCRPYIGIDACHLKGKWPGVLASATTIDGNNWMFPVAYAVMEGESQVSWEWFMSNLHRVIGTPDGLVISSDMQKGLQNATEKVYPSVEHKECMRHLFSNFKKQFQGDLFKFGLWGAARTLARTFSVARFDAYIEEIKKERPAAIDYLNKEHNKLWSRTKFGTIAKCDKLTNNIAETFNNWISEERRKPVVDLIDSIRQKIMVRFEQKRRVARSLKGPLVPKVADKIKLISRGLGGYDVRRSGDFCAEIHKSGMRWEVNLQEQKCSCRARQVRGIPCIHASAYIVSLRNPNWESYVDSCFTVARLKTTYANRIATMPSRDEWLKVDLGYKMLPPILKRPPGRPRKNRIKSSDEPKKRSHKCTRCGLYGHHRKTCKNPVSTQQNEDVTVQTTHSLKTKRGKSKEKARSNKKACTTSIYKLLQEDNV